MKSMFYEIIVDRIHPSSGLCVVGELYLVIVHSSGFTCWKENKTSQQLIDLLWTESHVPTNMAWKNLMTLCDIKVKVIKKINSFCRQKTGWMIHAEPFMLRTVSMFSKFILYPFWATFKCLSIYSNLLKFTQIYLHHHVQHWHWISLFPAIIIVSWHLRLSADG